MTPEDVYVPDEPFESNTDQIPQVSALNSKKFNILAGKADTRIGDENMTETDINIRNTQ